MGVVNTTYTFSGTDTITSAKLNNIIDDTTFTGDAIQGTTLQVVSPGKLAVSAGGITSNELASNSVITAKIADSNITTAKIADSNVTTAKIADANVTVDKLASNAVTTVKILDANVTPAKLSQPLTLSTAKNSTSGTSIDFTGIPSWVKRITVMFNGVSTNGTSVVQIRIGTGGSPDNSGYAGVVTLFNSSGAGARAWNTSGCDLERSSQAAASVRQASIVLSLVSSNTWVFSGSVAYTNTEVAYTTCGQKSLSGALDIVRLTTVLGTDNFDAGSVNIMYE
jgi:hypothetical protein